MVRPVANQQLLLWSLFGFVITDLMGRLLLPKRRTQIGYPLEWGFRPQWMLHPLWHRDGHILDTFQVAEDLREGYVID